MENGKDSGALVLSTHLVDVLLGVALCAILLLMQFPEEGESDRRVMASQTVQIQTVQIQVTVRFCSYMGTGKESLFIWLCIPVNPI